MTDQYCVAAEDRGTGRRQSITHPMTKEQAIEHKAWVMKSNYYNRYYKYFHVARFPYKSTKRT